MSNEIFLEEKDGFSSKKEKSEKWWRKDVNPIVSYIFLIGATLVIFGIGILFMKEYTAVWDEIDQRGKQMYLIEKNITPP